MQTTPKANNILGHFFALMPVNTTPKGVCAKKSGSVPYQKTHIFVFLAAFPEYINLAFTVGSKQR